MQTESRGLGIKTLMAALLIALFAGALSGGAAGGAAGYALGRQNSSAPSAVAQTTASQSQPAVQQNVTLKRGIAPAEPLAVILIILETVGGLCVALGLFTRFFAAAIAIEMSVIVYHHLPKFGWGERGYEYPLMWGLIMFVIALRGGGSYSLDRKLGWEL